MSYSLHKTTIQQARRILGKDAHQYSDDQILDILDTLTLMAKNEFMEKSSKKQQGIKL